VDEDIPEEIVLDAETAYRDACAKLDTHTISPLMSQLLEATTTLSLESYGLGTKGTIALSEAFPLLPHLDTLLLAANSICGKGIEAIADSLKRTSSLTHLSLDRNPLGEGGAIAVASLFPRPVRFSRRPSQLAKIPPPETPPTPEVDPAESLLAALQRMDSVMEVPPVLSRTNSHSSIGTAVSDCRDQCCKLVSLSIASCGIGDHGLVPLLQRLKTNDFLTTLNIAANHAGEHVAPAAQIMLQNNTVLTNLNLHWSLLRCGGAGHVSAGLQSNRSLTRLDLSWNGFGDMQPCAQLGEALGGDCSLVYLDLSYNRIDDRSACVLAQALKSNTSLLDLVMDGNPLGALGARQIIKAFSNEDNLDRVVHFGQCNLGMVDSAVFDPINPGGSYSLDMADPYSGTVVRNLLMLVYNKKGYFVKGSTRLNGDVFRLPISIDWEEMEGKMPTSGVLEFKFASTRTPPKERDIMLDSDLKLILKLMRQTEPSEMDQVMDMATSGDCFLTPPQVDAILTELGDNSSDRVKMVRRVLPRMPSADGHSKVLAMLTPAEKAQLDLDLSVSAKQYHPANSTGHYRLNLADSSDRDVFCRLMEKRTAFLKEKNPDVNNKSAELVGRPVGRSNIRTPLEWVFLNCKVDGIPFVPDTDWQIPYEGVVEMDFVEQIKPPFEATPVNSLGEEMERFNLAEGDAAKLTIIRQLSCSCYFTCLQAKHIVARFKSLSAREEVAVMLFSRITDWHGYTCCFLEHSFKPGEASMVRKRLGVHNLWTESSAIGYYDLNLVSNENRYVLAELIRLAIKEPGDNLVCCQYDSISFAVPNAWSSSVPREGRFTVYYCRTANVISNVMSQYPYHVFPPNFRDMQPAGGDWALKQRYLKIKNKMAAHFESGEAAFAAMNTDGSGELSTKEFAKGLREAGVYLEPEDLVFLFSVLDGDGSGEISEDELVEFWHMAEEAPDIYM